MEPIDAAFRAFVKFRDALADYDDVIYTEQDTRVKVIDKVIEGVLGWPLSEVFTESRAGKGYLDYQLTINGYTRCVIEAKRDGRPLGTQRRVPGRPHKLDGPVFETEAAREGIEQAITYCAYKGAELACVTNGREWIVFRGNRIGDGRDVLGGMAFVFPDHDGLADQFRLFWDLMSYDSCVTFLYRPYFQEAEGAPVRSIAFLKAVRPPSTQRYLETELGADIGRLMSSFFRRLSGDEDRRLLAECFVDTPESRVADDRLARISEDLINRISQLDSADAAALQDLIRRTLESGRQSFVVLVGTKGAGKSTFIERFFDIILDEALARSCVVAKVDLKASQGDQNTITEWLQNTLLAEVEETLFPDAPPTFDEIRGVFFFQEYLRLRQGPLKALYDRDREEFHVEFGRRIDDMRRNQPHRYLIGLLSNVVASRKKLPVVVFDNADHFTIEFQERVYQYARSIYEETLCLVLLPITDRTSWQLSRHGALQSFEHEALFLPTPPTRTILAKRIEFLQQRILDERATSGRYFTRRGIRLSLDNLAAFTASLQRVFLETDSISDWIGNLSNADVRRALQLSASVVGSPHLDVADLIKAYVGRNENPSVPQWKVKNALVRGSYDIYPAEQNEFVQNLFALPDDIESSPLLGLRLLKLLSDAPEKEHVGRFLAVEHVLDYMTAMQVSHRASLIWLDSLLKAGLCFSYDPTKVDISQAQRLEISPSGGQHLVWGSNDADYLKAMSEVTPIASRSTYERLKDLNRRPERDVWREKTRVFVEYLLDEDSRYCQVPGHDAYLGQLELSDALSSLAGE